MTNQVLDASFDQLNEAADEKILSSLTDPALREHVRGFSHPLMVRNLAKPGADIQGSLTFDKFFLLLQVCANVVAAGNELDAVKKQVIYNKDTSIPAVFFSAVPRGQALDAFGQLTAEQAHLLHMAVGLAGEAAEMLDAVVQHVLGAPLDVDNIVEEAGDSAFYLQGIIGADSVNSSLRHVLLANKVKLLGKRYASGGYTDAQAQQRADKAPGQ